MSKLLTRAAAIENRAFLKLLRKTGNVRLTCRELGLKYGTMQHRRRVHPAFAAKWDAALAFAQARFHSSGRKSPKAKRGSTSSERTNPSTAFGGPPPHELRSQGGAFRTVGGEMTVCRRNDGRLQMRRAQPGKLTREAEQAFLAALSATCNMSLAAAAVGSCFKAFDRRRKTDPAFARELRLALQQGYETLEMALLEGLEAYSHEHDDWRHNDPPAMPPMSINQALQLMYLHQKKVALADEPIPLRRRRGESREVWRERLAQMDEAREQRAREAFAVAEAERRERGEWTPLMDAEMRMMGLPDLAQVTGWSRADPAKAPHDPDTALFGGWRIAEMERELERRAWEQGG